MMKKKVTKKSILLIDGENFKHKVQSIIQDEGFSKSAYTFEDINLDILIKKVFQPYSDINIVENQYYCAKLNLDTNSPEQSKSLIAKQRKLKRNLTNQGINFVIKGNVRSDGGKPPKFREKGVDVQIAVDMVVMACDNKYKTIILCSSDSDLQPAVYEAKKRGVEIIYLGFSTSPNKGLMFTTNKNVLFRNPEILDAVGLN